MLHVASSTVVPNAIASPSIRPKFITNAFSGNRRLAVKREIRPNCISHHFSTDAKKLIDRKLVKIFESEINSNLLSLEKSMPAAPADFPFTIQDDPHKVDITLTREFDGEKIKIKVSQPWNTRELEESLSTDSDSVEENEKSDRDPAPCVPLKVWISKEVGKIMEFWISASADEITVCMISVKKPATDPDDDPLLCAGPYVVNIVSELHIALREFLEIRGIKESNVGFLPMYMVRRYRRRPMLALQNLKKFIEE